MTAQISHRDALSAELDKTLRESDDRWEEIRIAEREITRMKNAVSEFDITAQRLRMALFALDGEHDKSFGDSNIENNRRKNALKRGES
jgi:hypothetical protein